MTTDAQGNKHRPAGLPKGGAFDGRDRPVAQIELEADAREDALRWGMLRSSVMGIEPEAVRVRIVYAADGSVAEVIAITPTTETAIGPEDKGHYERATAFEWAEVVGKGDAVPDDDGRITVERSMSKLGEARDRVMVTKLVTKLVAEAERRSSLDT